MHWTHDCRRLPGHRLLMGRRGGEERDPFLPLALLTSLALLAGCGGDGGSGPSALSPVPVLGRVAPDSLHQADGTAQLTLYGDGFVQGSRVLWNGVERTPIFVSDRTLRLSFEAGGLEAPGEVEVAVRNPSPGGGTSAAHTVRVVPPHTCTTAGPSCLARLEARPGLFVRYYRSFEITLPNPSIRRALFVIHGLDRNVTYNFSTGILLAESRNALREMIVIAPFFQAADDNPAPDEYYWATGGWARGHLSLTGGPTPRVSSYEVVDLILQRLTDLSVFPALEEIVVAGHSAGGQYVHRFASGSPVEDGVAGLGFRYVVANPSTFLYLGPERPDGSGGFSIPEPGACPDYNAWHRGLESRNTYMNRLTDEEIRSNLVGRDLRILLGTSDTGSTDLDVTCGGMLQGEHRYARGVNILAYMDAFQPGHRHRGYEVPGVGHSSRQMFGSFKGLQAIFDP